MFPPKSSLHSRALGDTGCPDMLNLTATAMQPIDIQAELEKQAAERAVNAAMSTLKRALEASCPETHVDPVKKPKVVYGCQKVDRALHS